MRFLALLGALVVTGGVGAGGLVISGVLAGGGGGVTCTGANVTTATFAARVTAASPGDVLCLSSGNYGVWAGTNKAITVLAIAGQSPVMTLALTASSTGFTIDGVGGLQMSDSGSANVTIKNSTFTSGSEVDHPTNLMFDGDHWDWNCGGQSKIYVAGKQTGTIASPSVTIKNSTFTNGECDGVHMGATDASTPYSHGVVILNNRFQNLCDIGANHTDNIQFDAGADQVRIAGNYIYEAQSCPTQGITDYDGNVGGTVLVEDNVVDVPRNWGIEFYAVSPSASLTIRHNTVVFHPNGYAEFPGTTGNIDLGLKTGQTCGGASTVVRDSVADPSGPCTSSATVDHNTSPSTVTYVNGALTSTSVYADAFLTAGSAGHLAASDGADTGVLHTVP